MGSRGRSIRLRIYLLVAIPLVTMIGLLAYAVTTTVHNAINLDRAPALFNATAVPAADFTNDLQAERLAAVVYIFQPTPGNLAAYQSAINKTNADEPTFVAHMTSPDTKSAETPTIAQAINGDLQGLSQLKELRQGVVARLIGPGQPMTALDALGAYSQGIQNGPKLFLAEASTVADPTAASQALALIATVSAHEALAQEDALLSGMLAANKASQADRAAFAEMASTRQGDTVDWQSLFDPYNLAVYNAGLKGTGQLQQQLTQIEGAVAGGVPMGRLGIGLAQWQQLAGTLLQANFTAGVNDVAAQLAVDHQITHSAWERVAYTSGIALAGLLLTIIVTTMVGRAIIRRLRGLERTALTLAEEQLPEVISRLRQGEDVDVAVEAPPLRIGSDEIGRVGQAFDLVRQTAIRSAVEEARLRRGLNDVFRSLARRSQSLLHRQLTLLDQMERRASDPEALDDLFRLDHLTTRMRRHAEGLVILAGAPAGRGWSSPVRMVDVMRGAIAEVEDYARVSVATRSQAALSGSAVADVIHLLAELIENATTLSPPYTSVRVSGDTVANGFAIEVEDRGLGVSEHRLTELNERLANPPEFNPSDSEQLGLFVVSQLAKRHGIKVTLKASPYGGTEAVVLIPRHLVVTEEAFRASLPGEPVAITGGSGAANGNHFAEFGNGQSPGGPLSGDPLSGGPLHTGTPGATISGGPRISGALRRAHGSIPDGLLGAGRGEVNGGSGTSNGNGHGFGAGLTDGFSASGDEFPAPDNGFGARAVDGEIVGGPAADLSGSAADQALEPEGPLGADGRGLPRRRNRGQPGGGRPSAAGEPPSSDLSGASGLPGAPGASGAQGPFGPATARYTTGQASSFPGWPGQNAPPTPMTPITSGGGGVGGSGSGRVSKPPWELSPETGPLPVVPGTAEPVLADGNGPAGGDYKGLPRRVKQANIAPQLRGDPVTHVRPSAPPGGDSGGTGGVGGVGGAGQPGGPSPAEIRATMSALQRGWQEGRAQRAAASEPPWEQAPAAEENSDGA